MQLLLNEQDLIENACVFVDLGSRGKIKKPLKS
jgi:hypothetical protein